MDLAEYLSKVDFTKGSQWFHIKWPIGALERKESPEFKMTVVDGNKKNTIRWKLTLNGDDIDSDDPEDKWIGLQLLSVTVVPVVVRLALVHAGREQHALWWFRVFNTSNDDKEEDTWGNFMRGMTKAATTDYVVHCWIAIPKGVVLLDPNVKISSSTGFNRPMVLTVFQRDMTELFNTVTVGDDTSDVTLVILKKIKQNGNDSEGPLAKTPKREEIVCQFYCHQNILATRSTVFGTVLREKSKGNERSKLEIDDVDQKTMEIILRYIYTSDVPDQCDDLDSLAKVISAADKYRLKHLKDHCIYLMIKKDTDLKQRIEHLRVADRQNLYQLKAICVSQLSINLGSISNKEIIESIETDLFAEITKAAYERSRDATVINLE